ncbi:DUF2283 domain-containing protein [Arthrobacter celericrescens]|uniref:DUF2283 domain-containing protein n=1 Tax=Arthrobacter celericrescens TaxID=2320851 RepID=UPI000EA0BC9E|nr:DUF2283 domain-containing protein [Arthrobacter celericrescens]
MRIKYDPSANAAYIYLVEDIYAGSAAKTYSCDPIEVGGMINLDFDRDGRLIGVEVMDADKRLTRETLAEANPDRDRKPAPPAE